MLQAALRTSYTTWPSRRSSRLHVARTSWVTTVTCIPVRRAPEVGLWKIADPKNRTAPALECAGAGSGHSIDSRGRSCLR